MAQINAYITFDGNCKQAMKFYQECFGGKMILETVKGSPMETHWPASAQNNILHASLDGDDFSLIGSDMVPSDGLKHGNAISLVLLCSTEEEIERLFQKLSVEGTVKYPLHAFYNGKIGGVVDKYNTHWMLKL
jgi:PhnB protein